MARVTQSNKAQSIDSTVNRFQARFPPRPPLKSQFRYFAAREIEWLKRKRCPLNFLDPISSCCICGGFLDCQLLYFFHFCHYLPTWSLDKVKPIVSFPYFWTPYFQIRAAKRKWIKTLVKFRLTHLWRKKLESRASTKSGPQFTIFLG